MRQKTFDSSKHWWQANPEMALALGWAVIFGGLWLLARLSGLL